MGYQFQSRVRYSEVGEDKKLTLPKIVDYLQDCSTFQSESLGVGLGRLTEKQRAWILAYWKIQVFRYPSLGETITAETWPYSFKGFYGGRNFTIRDDAGAVCVQADSLWVFLDVGAGHPAKIDEEELGAYSIESPIPMGKMIRKIHMPESGEKREPFPVLKSHLDTNHHVNNGQYILMAMEYLPPGFPVFQVRVEYRRSALLHDRIMPYVYTDPEKGICTVSLCSEEGEPFAVLEFMRTETGKAVS